MLVHVKRVEDGKVFLSGVEVGHRVVISGYVKFEYSNKISESGICLKRKVEIPYRQNKETTVIGMKYRCEGEHHRCRGYGEDFEPASFKCTKKYIVYQTRQTLKSPIVEVLAEQIIKEAK